MVEIKKKKTLILNFIYLLFVLSIGITLAYFVKESNYNKKAIHKIKRTLPVKKMESDFSFDRLDWSMKDEGKKSRLPSAKFLGKYYINVSGFKGVLHFGIKNGQLVGAIRFPNWANGAIEYLKKIRINGHRLRFIRSVSTPKEKKRIGVSRYFVQKYFGKYSKKGRCIHGYFLDGGSEYTWNAGR